jgi:hypothetical protein
MPLEWVFERNMQVIAETCYDEAYYARSLARKVDVPFVMETDFVTAPAPGNQDEGSSKKRRG